MTSAQPDFDRSQAAVRSYCLRAAAWDLSACNAQASGPRSDISSEHQFAATKRWFMGTMNGYLLRPRWLVRAK
jgi:hypothetical protein